MRVELNNIVLPSPLLHTADNSLKRSGIDIYSIQGMELSISKGHHLFSHISIEMPLNRASSSQLHHLF